MPFSNFYLHLISSAFSLAKPNQKNPTLPAKIKTPKFEIKKKGIPFNFHYRFSLTPNFAVRHRILIFKTSFDIYISRAFISYLIKFLWHHYFWVKIDTEVRRAEIIIIFPKTSFVSV